MIYSEYDIKHKHTHTHCIEHLNFAKTMTYCIDCFIQEIIFFTTHLFIWIVFLKQVCIIIHHFSSFSVLEKRLYYIFPMISNDNSDILLQIDENIDHNVNIHFLDIFRNRILLQKKKTIKKKSSPDELPSLCPWLAHKAMSVLISI